MSSFKRDNKANLKKSMNHKHIPSHVYGHNLHASSVVCYDCGTLGHVNSVCPRRRGINGMKAVLIRKDVLKTLIDCLGPKNSRVPRVNV